MEGSEMSAKRSLRAVLMTMAAVVLLLANLVGTQAEESSWTDPAANAADKGGGFSNPENAYMDGSGHAVVDDCPGTGVAHRYGAYDVAVPHNATIDGIEVRLDYWVLQSYGDNTASVELSWDGGRSWTAPQTDASEPLAESTVTFGGPTDTWGHTWTPGEFHSDSFLVRVTFVTNT